MASEDSKIEEDALSYKATIELFMLTVGGLENYAQKEVEQLLNPSSIRIIRGMLIVKFEQMSLSLLQKMRNLRSVSKIISLVGEFNDIPSKKDKFESFLNEKVMKITKESKIAWMESLKIWRMSCFDASFFAHNPSIPKRTRARCLNSETDKERKINFKNPSFRCNCSRKGNHEWKSLLIEKEIAAPFYDIFGFDVNLTLFDIEIFAFVRGQSMFYGLSIISDLNRRNRKVMDWRTIKDNTICFLMGKVAQIESNMVIYDPLCGLGSILIENKMALAKEFKNVKFIGSDINKNAINQAMVNAKYCKLKTNENVNIFEVDWTDTDKIEFYQMDIMELSENEIKNECVDLILSDIPFGHNCGSHKGNRKMYPKMLRAMHRILKKNGKALLITTERKVLMRAMVEMNEKWKYETMEIDVGGYNALLFILSK